MSILIERQKVPERSTAAFEVSFFDEAGAAVVPTSITWSLYNRREVIMNDREDVVVTPTAATVTIITQGDDHVYADGDMRRLVVDALYNSSNGTGLPLRSEIQYRLENLAG